MQSAKSPQPRATITAARIIGPVLVAGGALMITQHQRVMGVIDAFLDNDAIMVLAAFFALTIGMAIVVLHNYWGGITQCVVTLLGWISLVRGGLILFAPGLAREAAVLFITAPNLLPVLGLIVALLGLWLVVFSFIAPPEDGLGYFGRP